MTVQWLPLNKKNASRVQSKLWWDMELDRFGALLFQTIENMPDANELFFFKWTRFHNI